MKGITLVVVAGADSGRTFPVGEGCFRVLGRASDDPTVTAVVAYSEQRRLEREDQRRIAEHLRARAAPGLPGAREEVASFERCEDMELRDDAVSLTHAMVFCDEAGASLVDVASTNGTWLNGARVSDSALVDGDLLRVGSTRIEVRRGTHPAEPDHPWRFGDGRQPNRRS